MAATAQRHRDLEIVDAALPEGAMHRIEEVLVVDEPHDDADGKDDLRQDVPKLVELLLQGRGVLLTGCFAHSTLNGSDLGGHTSGHHASNTGSIRDRG